jgi:hypothetical protein
MILKAGCAVCSGGTSSANLRGGLKEEEQEISLQVGCER